MRYITKLIAPAILAVSLVGVAGCDNESQAQASSKTTTAQAVSVKASPDQISSVSELLEKVRKEAILKEAHHTDDVAPPVTPVVKLWTVKTGQSHIKFTALQEGGIFEGEFETFTSDIKFHPDFLDKSSVTITVPLSGIDAGNTDRNSTLPGKVWFSTKKFPDAVFTANKFKLKGEGAYEAMGELIIKGVSRPLTLPFTLDIDDDKAVMRSTLEMNRTEWNIGEKPWNTDEWVSTGVKLDIMVTARAVH